MANPKVSQEKFLWDICGDFFYAGTDKKLYTYLWTIKGNNGKKTFQTALTEPSKQELDDCCEKLKNLSVYFSINLLDSKPTGRAKANDIACGRCVWLDVDIAGPGHKEKNKLFPNKPLARKWIDSLPLKYSYLVDTGGGYQVYWLLEDTESAAVIANLEAQVIAFCKEQSKGYHLDNVQSIDRVFRLPGTNNCKIANNIRPCEIVDYTGNYYTVDEVKAGFKTAGFKTSGVKRRADRPQSLADLPKPAVGLSIDQLRAEIMQIKFSDSFSYDDWLHVLMGLHHETGGSEEGLNLAHEWSQTDQRSDGKGGKLADDLKGIVDKWVSFGKEERDKVRTWSGVRYDHKIKPTGIKDLESIADLVACAEQFDFSDRAVEAIMKRGAELKIKTDLRNAIKKARKLHIAKGKLKDGLIYFSEGKGGFCKKIEGGWSFSDFSSEARNVGGTATMQDMLDTGLIEKVTGVRYAPGEERIFSDGEEERFLNLCNTWPMDVDVEIDPLTHARFIGHLKDSMGEDWQVAMDWMAYIYQNPGHRVVWGLVITGDQGTGKSTIADMFCRALGRGNATIVPGDALLEDFNGWISKSLVTIEEIHLPKQSHKERAYNKLKQYLGSPTVNWHRKGIDRIEVENVTNFILISNTIGCLPFNIEQRRFAPIIMKNKGWDLNHFEAVFGPFGCYQDVDGDINLFRRMLLDHQISADFKTGQAPQTKSMAASKEDSLSDTALDLREIIKGKQSLKIRDVMQLLEMAKSTAPRSTRAIKTAFEELDWVRVDEGRGYSHYEPKNPVLRMVKNDELDFGI